MTATQFFLLAGMIYGSQGLDRWKCDAFALLYFICGVVFFVADLLKG